MADSTNCPAPGQHPKEELFQRVVKHICLTILQSPEKYADLAADIDRMLAGGEPWRRDYPDWYEVGRLVNQAKQTPPTLRLVGRVS